MCGMDEEKTSNKFCVLFVLDETIYQTLCTDSLGRDCVVKKIRHIVGTLCSRLLFALVFDEFEGKAIFFYSKFDQFSYVFSQFRFVSI